MIVNSWKNTIPVCDFCGKVMTLEMAKSGFGYKCPNCSNLISDKRFEKILDKLSELEDEMYNAKEIGTLTDRTFTVGKGVKCKVLEDDGEGRFTVSIRNLEI